MHSLIEVLTQRSRRSWVVVVCAMTTAGCGSAEPTAPTADAGTAAQACIAPLSLDCQVAFPPQYSNIFNNVFLTTCGSPSSGTSCHGPNGKQGGLVLAESAAAYDNLLGQIDGRARVVPFKPECSILEQRLESTDPMVRMPRGSGALPDGVRCAVRQWIAQGALQE